MLFCKTLLGEKSGFYFQTTEEAKSTIKPRVPLRPRFMPKKLPSYKLAPWNSLVGQIKIKVKCNKVISLVMKQSCVEINNIHSNDSDDSYFQKFVLFLSISIKNLEPVTKKKSGIHLFILLLKNQNKQN